MRGLGRILTLVLALAVVAMPAAASAEKTEKKKGGGAKVFRASIAPNAAVPDSGGSAVRSAPLRSTIKVPKAFKGKVVGDVDVTGINITGSAAGAANDLIAYLISPSGRTFELFYQVGDRSLGAWTIDDDTSTSICPTAGPLVCTNSTQSLLLPFNGTSNALYNWAGAFPVNGTLAIFNGLKMTGTWTLLLTDTAPPGVGNGTSVLNTWGLKITPAKSVAG